MTHNFGTINDDVMKLSTDVLHQQREQIDVIIFVMTSLFFLWRHHILLNYDPILCVIQNRFTAAVLLIVRCTFVFGKVRYLFITYQTVFPANSPNNQGNFARKSGKNPIFWKFGKIGEIGIVTSWNFPKKIPNHRLSVWSKFQVNCFNNAEGMPIFVIRTCYPRKMHQKILKT